MKNVRGKKQEQRDMNPGGFLAVKKGCTCPIMDNAHGEGIPLGNGEVGFWSNGDCPVHNAPLPINLSKEKK